MSREGGPPNPGVKALTCTDDPFDTPSRIPGDLDGHGDGIDDRGRLVIVSEAAAAVVRTMRGGGDPAHLSASQVRAVAYWRRLVAARLDLAVAALTVPDEPPPPAAARSGCWPGDLRRLVGLPACDLLAEAGALERLRDVLAELDTYLAAQRVDPPMAASAHPDTLRTQTT